VVVLADLHHDATQQRVTQLQGWQPQTEGKYGARSDASSRAA
jgi:hypothetical protein